MSYTTPTDDSDNTIRPSDLTPAERELWDARVWETLDATGHHFLRSSSRSSSSTTHKLHIPMAFFDGDDPHEPYESVPHDAAACYDKRDGGEWRVKPTSAYPQGYSPICSFCLYKFDDWWAYVDRVKPPDDPRPTHLLGGVDG